jgi:hypothetical protein
MTDPDRPAVPGLEPADGRTRPLDLSQDPDRFENGFDVTDHPRVVEPTRALDPAQDPDRYDPGRDLPPGQGQSLTDLLGEGSYEGQRDGYQWVAGLLGVVAFLALVAFLFGEVLSP